MRTSTSVLLPENKPPCVSLPSPCPPQDDPGQNAVPGFRSITSRRILSVGDDFFLLETREMVLRSEGFAVASVPGFLCDAQLSQVSFDLLILCHTLQAMQAHLASLARTMWPELPILLLLGPSALSHPRNTTVIMPSPDLLIRTVRAMSNPGAGAQENFQPREMPSYVETAQSIPSICRTNPR